LCAAALFLADGYSVAQGTARGSISGRITDKATGKPLSGVVVELRLIPSLAPPCGRIGTTEDVLADEDPVTAAAETAADGAFSVINLQPCDYVMRVRKAHYLPQDYGQLVWGGKGRRLTVHAGEHLGDRDFRLSSESVITGKVVNQNGSPMERVDVIALARRPAPSSSWRPYENGEWTLKEASRTSTDNSGRYRLEQLAPGDYYVRIALSRYVSVGAPQGNSGQGAPDNPPNPLDPGRLRLRPTELVRSLEQPLPPSYGKDQEFYLPQLHPGVSSPVLASSISVATPGIEVRGIDFIMRPTRLRTITGKVLPPPEDDQKAAGGADGLPSLVEIGLYPTGLGSNLEDPDSSTPRAKAIVSAEADGTFQFTGVLPGAYKVIAVGRQGTRRVTAIRDIFVDLSGAQSLTLPLQYGLNLQGKILLKGPVPESYRLQAQQVMLQIDDLFPGLSQYFPRFSASGMVNVGADGAFVLPDVVPDAHYNVPMRLLGAYVTIRYGEEPMPRWVFTRKDELRLEITLEFGTARVDLVVQDGGQPQREATTVLVPADRNRRQYFQVRRSGPDGKVVFETVAPGDYDVFAWDEVRDLAWFDPTFMNQFNGRARRIRVGPSGITSDAIQIIAAHREVN
jgi:protocatechuate 3,4-dioxygenase beta subunit